MTIRINICNEESRESAAIVVQTVNLYGQPCGTADERLGPQENADFYVHSNQRLIIDEVKAAK